MPVSTEMAIMIGWQEEVLRIVHGVREVNIDSTPEATVLRLIVKLPGKMKAEQVVEELSGASGVTGAHWKR